jgi:nucleobase:cation symporter-1, NCS1 family
MAASNSRELLPLSQAERTWSLLDVISVKSGLVIATWAFLFGGTTANYLGFWDGMLAMLIGNAIGAILLIFGAILPSAKWGTEYFVHQRSALGARGAQALAIVSVAPGAVFWAAILATTTGRAAVELAHIVPGGAQIPEGLLVGAVAAGFLALGWAFAARGDAGGQGAQSHCRALAPSDVRVAHGRHSDAHHPRGTRRRTRARADA